MRSRELFPINFATLLNEFVQGELVPISFAKLLNESVQGELLTIQLGERRRWELLQLGVRQKNEN